MRISVYNLLTWNCQFTLWCTMNNEIWLKRGRISLISPKFGIFQFLYMKWTLFQEIYERTFCSARVPSILGITMEIYHIIYVWGIFGRIFSILVKYASCLLKFPINVLAFVRKLFVIIWSEIWSEYLHSIQPIFNGKTVRSGVF